MTNWNEIKKPTGHKWRRDGGPTLQRLLEVADDAEAKTLIACAVRCGIAWHCQSCGELKDGGEKSCRSCSVSRPRAPMDNCGCETFGGFGWLHMSDSCGRGPGIERCDVCKCFSNDDEAAKAHAESYCCDMTTAKGD